MKNGGAREREEFPERKPEVDAQSLVPEIAVQTSIRVNGAKVQEKMVIRRLLSKNLSL